MAKAAPSFISDEPTLEDLIQRTELVEHLSEQIASCEPPFVFGAHGDWGSGKTSFLDLLHLRLAGACPQRGFQEGEKATKDAFQKAFDRPYKKGENDCTVVWFEAWRYQNEASPIVALLQEIRAQLPWTSRILKEAGKLGEVGIRGAFLSLEDITKKIGLQVSKIEQAGEDWEKANLAYALPTNTIRELLERAIKPLVGREEEGRLVVLIDDLDRCDCKCAYKLLEGIKIYLNLRNCVFVLGMNQKVIEEAIAATLQREGRRPKGPGKRANTSRRSARSSISCPWRVTRARCWERGSNTRR